MVRAYLAITPFALALVSVSCDESGCPAGCPGSSFIHAFAADGLLEADEAVIELDGSVLTCTVADGGEPGDPRCEADVRVARGSLPDCSSGSLGGCPGAPTAAIDFNFNDFPRSPVTITLRRGGQDIATKQFPLQDPVTPGGVECGACPWFTYDWRVEE